VLKTIRSLILSASCLFGPAVAQGQALHRLDVNVFNSGTVWPLWVAQEKGFFASNGLDVHLIPTPGSLAQMEGLIDGKFDIAMTAIDNLIAYMEGEGEATTRASLRRFAKSGPRSIRMSWSAISGPTSPQ